MEDKNHIETLPDGTVVEHREDSKDAKTGAKIGGVGGAVVGGIAGAAASGAAVDAVDKHDDDTTLTGLPAEHRLRNDNPRVDAAGHRVDEFGNRIVDKADDIRARADRAMDRNNLPGIQTGGHAVDGTPDTRGVSEKVADAVTGDRIDDKTGKRIR